MPQGYAVRTYPLHRLQQLLGLLTLAFLAARFSPTFQLLQGVHVMPLWLHNFVEMFSTAVALLMFGVVWNAYSRERSGNMVFLGCAFLAVGLIDFAHLLSYKGMPDFITPASPQKAISFWLAERAVAAGALLAVALRPWRPLSDSRRRYILLAGSLALTAFVYWAGLFHPDAWPVFFVDGAGLTDAKILAEYATILVLGAAALLFHRSARRADPAFDAGSLFAVAVISILSGLCFTSYTGVNDVFNLLGHVFKIVAYLFLYRAAFVACVREPFRKMHVEIGERKLAEEALRELNQSLEQRVAQRTVQLELANKELEAFSYSVSHDLRAPLRAIDGFSQILHKNYMEHLDDKGRDYLARVRRASQRMGELIDDMLLLAQLSRKEVSRQQVDISALARAVLDELKQASPERRVETRVADGMAVDADPKLIRIVLENLLGNAWKFTGKTADARIEVGRADRDGMCAIFVRDNGAGFSMAYAHKLFGPFQRLHAASEFEGSGIGLATVQRIIQRHGGRVWAEGREGEGATFYFCCDTQTGEAVQ
ncbi:MAG TPA: MASE3 domain-containing protein [Noviherbaspirillum sp.]|uniref:MASE3 domain-containing protein n=1 Tax=Noviherbaspirillum sp. TaxID=1926288 RepID=UPI002D407E10|nr:MASE3 domain-containing protein [Noviherbaspirillum sp.]HYD94498.1 MASE3 domain-containing protein [Noviherbaspirillum sp.]